MYGAGTSCVDVAQRQLAESRPADESVNRELALAESSLKADAGLRSKRTGYRAQHLITARVNSGQRNVAVCRDGFP